MSIEKLEEFKVVKVSYIKEDSYALELEGKISLKGRIKIEDFYGYEIITVMSKMPYDQSYVEVKGLYPDFPVSTGVFSLFLDSGVRDNTSYEIFMVELR